MSHQVRLFVLAIVSSLAAAACGGAGGSPGASGAPTAGGAASSGAIPALANVTLSNEHATRTTVGPEGGSVQATGPNGVRYALTIPRGAVITPVEIAVVPLAGAKDLPGGVTLAGGVHLLPEGLQFTTPASLDMQLAAGDGTTLAAFAYAGDLVDRHLYPARRGDATVTFPIVHFSGYGALQATDIAAAFPWFPPPGGAGEASLHTLMTIFAGGDVEANEARIAATFRDWLDNIESIATQSVLGSEFAPDWITDSSSAVSRATANLKAFRVAAAHAAFEFALTFPDVDEDFQALAVQVYEHLLDATNRSCAAFPDQALATLVPEMVGWRGEAEWILTPALLPESLSLSRLETSLCARPVFDPNGGLDFPTELLAGQSGQLRVRAGYTLPGLEPRYDAPMAFIIQGTNAEPAAAQFSTEPGLSGTADFTWTAGTERIALIVSACLADLLPVGLLVCEQDVVERGFVPAPPSCPTFTATAGSKTVTTDDTWSSTSASVSPANGFASASIGGNLSMSMGVAGNRASVHADATFVVDSVSAGPGSQHVELAWFGGAFWRGSDQTGNASVSISMTVNGQTYAPEIRVPTTDRGILIVAPLEVDHGDVIDVSFQASASHGDTSHDLEVSGSLEFVTAPYVSIHQSECEAD